MISEGLRAAEIGFAAVDTGFEVAADEDREVGTETGLNSAFDNELACTAGRSG